LQSEYSPSCRELRIADLLLHRVILLGPVEMSLPFSPLGPRVFLSRFFISALEASGNTRRIFFFSFLFGFTSLAAATGIGGDREMEDYARRSRPAATRRMLMPSLSRALNSHRLCRHEADLRVAHKRCTIALPFSLPLCPILITVYHFH
jgi:hypothetical protein